MTKFDFSNIKAIEYDFKNYVCTQLFNSKEEIILLKNLMKNGDVFIFGGVIRDYFLEQNDTIEHRDIDLVAENINEKLETIFSQYLIKRTRFGGFKLKINSKIYDIWPLSKTWTINYHTQIKYLLYKFLPSTSFFNITAVIFSLKKSKFFMHEDFQKSITHKRLDIVNIHNPFPELCIVKTYEYKTKYDLKLSKKLKEFVLKYYNIKRNKLIDIQKSHYGYVRHSVCELDKFFDEIKADYQTVNHKSHNKKQLELNLNHYNL